MQAQLLRGPSPGSKSEELEYSIKPRPKAKFHTVLDSKAMFGDRPHSSFVKTVSSENDFTMEVKHHFSHGVIREELHGNTGDAVQVTRFHRSVTGTTGTMVRSEEAHFTDPVFPFPQAIYPETAIPFLLRYQPFDGRKRAVYAWGGDRFVARVYFEGRGKKVKRWSKGSVYEVWMYPDLNDWIAMGSMLTRLVKPILPRYSMWYETEPPHRLVRFEGSYGPPGAPEVLLELKTR